jgi:uncharacterized membrane protein
MATMPSRKTPRRQTSSAPISLHASTPVAVPGDQGPRIVRAVTIRRPAAELYAFWRDVENLQRVIKDPVGITAISANESHWRVTAPTGTVEWDSLIINDEPGSLIAWRSREGAEVPNAGTVRFEPAPGDEGTEVTVALEYDPPGGTLGKLAAKFTGEDAGLQIYITLKRFKALMEAGEIPTTDGQSVGGPQASAKGKK